MDWNVFLLFVALCVAFLMYFLFDVNYFLRSSLMIVLGKFCRSRIKFLGTSEIYGIVITTDVDLLLTHMNNARVFREFDFCRFDHLTRNGMLGIIWRENGGGVVSAQTCRYRKPLDMFMMYKIVTKPAYYDNKNIFFEHKVISLKDGMVRCIAYVKLTFTMDLDKIVANHYPDTEKPSIPKDMELWMDYIRVNSERIRNKRSKSRSPNPEDRGTIGNNSSNGNNGLCHDGREEDLNPIEADVMLPLPSKEVQSHLPQ